MRHRYNYNITEKTGIEIDPDTGKAHQYTYYDYEFVQFDGVTDYATIVRRIIREKKNETQEFELLNRYNAYVLGVSQEKQAETDYIAWLTYVESVKQMVKTDLGFITATR